MAASPDAVRNFVYDFHLYNLKQGWAVVQQLVEHELDSWEKIHAAFPVADPNGNSNWSQQDERQVAAFTKNCPLLGNAQKARVVWEALNLRPESAGDKLAAQLVAQASLFVNNPKQQLLERGNSVRLGSLRERINRLYFKEKLPSIFKQTFGNGVRSQGDKGRLVPFLEAVDHPGFLS